MIVTTSHASLINGSLYEAPANTITEALQRLGAEFLFVRNSLDGKTGSMVYGYRGTRQTLSRRLAVVRHPSPLRYLSEVVAVVSFFLFRRRYHPLTFIGVDPLNCASGIIMKKLGRTKAVVYFTVDYTVQRFKNRFLNGMYHRLDRWCARNADVIWNVSSRIQRVRETMGIPASKNLLVPNVPSDEYRTYLANPRVRHRLVTLGVLSSQMDYLGMFEAVGKLRSEYPDIELVVIGSGPKGGELRAFVRQHGLEAYVRFTGHLDHGHALEEISRSGVGLALYNGAWSFNHFGDSMKCREYFCFGLPVITTDTHSTVEEIRQYGAGVVCSLGADAYYDAINTVFRDYDRFSRSATALAGRYANIHERLLSQLPR